MKESDATTKTSSKWKKSFKDENGMPITVSAPKTRKKKGKVNSMSMLKPTASAQTICKPSRINEKENDGRWVRVEIDDADN